MKSLVLHHHSRCYFIITIHPPPTPPPVWWACPPKQNNNQRFNLRFWAADLVSIHKKPTIWCRPRTARSASPWMQPKAGSRWGSCCWGVGPSTSAGAGEACRHRNSLRGSAVQQLQHRHSPLHSRICTSTRACGHAHACCHHSAIGTPCSAGLCVCCTIAPAAASGGGGPGSRQCAHWLASTHACMHPTHMGVRVMRACRRNRLCALRLNPLHVYRAKAGAHCACLSASARPRQPHAPGNQASGMPTSAIHHFIVRAM